jgi:hypothetical protein
MGNAKAGMMRQRLSLSADQVRQLDAVSATLRVHDRDKFRFDVIRALELRCGLRPVSNNELEQAISDTVGIVPLQGHQS